MTPENFTSPESPEGLEIPSTSDRYRFAEEQLAELFEGLEEEARFQLEEIWRVSEERTHEN